MKKHVIVILLLACATALFAQDNKRAAIGLGPEWNMHSRFNFAMGGALNFDITIDDGFAAGIGFSGSNNFTGITTLAAGGLFRAYIPGKKNFGFFIQTDIGAFFILEDKEVTTMFMNGLRAGYRFLLGQDKKFYVEPYGRLGYPSAFGIGVLGGLRF